MVKVNMFFVGSVRYVNTFLSKYVADYGKETRSLLILLNRS